MCGIGVKRDGAELSGQYTHMIDEDFAHALYTMGQNNWVILGCSKTPRKAMKRHARNNSILGDYMRYGVIYWFDDKVLAKRVMGDTLSLLKRAGIKRSGNNQSPMLCADIQKMDMVIKYAARQAGISIIPEETIFKARGLRDARILRRIHRC